MYLCIVFFCMKVKIDLDFWIEIVENLNRDIFVGYINSLVFFLFFVSGGVWWSRYYEVIFYYRVFVWNDLFRVFFIFVI